MEFENGKMKKPKSGPGKLKMWLAKKVKMKKANASTAKQTNLKSKADKNISLEVENGKNEKMKAGSGKMKDLVGEKRSK